ncbi:hypothetical protein AC1031_000049 [Aphanomyces cochlioides]|nr:hypothetical protein AC1031_000049 [Aphanomyces cochlioides]
MVPAVWLGLDVMPQNSNGKIDRKSLEALSVETQNEPLVTDAEKAMAGLWAELLNVDMETIGRNSSFYALGGDSISTIKLSKLVETTFKVASFSVKTIWKYPRLSTMTEAVFSSYAQTQGHSSRTATHRIVCFHGRGSNPHHFKHQLSPIIAELGDSVEWIFLQGSFTCSDSDLQEFYPNMDFYSWFTESEIPAVTLGRIFKDLAGLGKVDAIVGFSEGALVVEALDVLASQGRQPKIWRTSILASSPGLSKFLPQSEADEIQTLNVPSIFFHGPQDAPISIKYWSPTILLHESGHDVSHDPRFVYLASEAIRKAID